jgi:serine/threonine-protein kinase
MYFMMTGQVPTESIFRSTRGLQNPRDLNPAISEKIERMILKAMALNASDRYQSVMELLLDLDFDTATDKIDLTSFNYPDYPEVAPKITAPYDVDAEDETMIRSNVATNEWQKIHGWIYLIAPLLISGLLALVLFGNFGKKQTDLPSIEPAYSTNHQDSVKQQLSSHPEDDQVDSTKKTNLQANQTNDPAPKPEDVKQENYRKIYNAAVAAYNQKNFDHALELFNEAGTYIKTAEIEQYKTLIAQEKEKIEIQNRRNNYDELMNFGIFVVVKKKSDNRFGAIDEKGFEKIPCKYVSTDKVGNNRLFQRDDNLYDKYAPSGVLLEEGTNGLE